MRAEEETERVVYVVTGPRGFTEMFGLREVEVLERLGLIEHDRDGYVLTDGSRHVGPLHRFYRAAVR